ncbi:MAG: PRTRC system protein E [Bryobacterales bacterium]|nr:PRTRC system protein E [Bryobacterales bacterium]
MFTELLPLVKERTLMLTIAGIGDDALRVNLIPQRKTGRENDPGEAAMVSPLTITGTAEELDREFVKQITGFQAALEHLKSNLGEIESAHAAALKAVEEEKKKELNSKKKAAPAASVKPAVRHDAEPVSSPANGKLVFGNKPQSSTAPLAQSLFDSEDPATQGTQAAPSTSAVSTASSPQASDTAAKLAAVQCGICHGPILPNQQRHPLMPFPAHANATDCEAARKAEPAAPSSSASAT